MPLRSTAAITKRLSIKKLHWRGGAYDSDIGGDWWIDPIMKNFTGKQMEEFTRDEYGFFLVTRLTGYS